MDKVADLAFILGVLAISTAYFWYGIAAPAF
jgi:hypothetical protein